VYAEVEYSIRHHFLLPGCAFLCGTRHIRLTFCFLTREEFVEGLVLIRHNLPSSMGFPIQSKLSSIMTNQLSVSNFHLPSCEIRIRWRRRDSRLWRS
jgi:hypothetical protein